LGVHQGVKVTPQQYSNAVKTLEKASGLFERATFPLAEKAGRKPSVTALKSACDQATDAVIVLRRFPAFGKLAGDGGKLRPIADLRIAKQALTEPPGDYAYEVADAAWSLREALLGWRVLRGEADATSVVAEARDLFSRPPQSLTPHEFGTLMSFSGEYAESVTPVFSSPHSGHTLLNHIVNLRDADSDFWNGFLKRFEEYGKEWRKVNDVTLTPDKVQSEVLQLFAKVPSGVSKKRAKRLLFLLTESSAGRELVGPRDARLLNALSMHGTTNDGPQYQRWLRTFAGAWGRLNDPQNREASVERLRQIGKGELPTSFDEQYELSLLLPYVADDVFRGLDERDTRVAAANLLQYAPDITMLERLLVTCSETLPKTAPQSLKNAIQLMRTAASTSVGSPKLEALSWKIIHGRTSAELRRTTMQEMLAIARTPAKDWSVQQVQALRRAVFGMPLPPGGSAMSSIRRMTGAEALRYFDPNHPKICGYVDRMARTLTRLFDGTAPTTREELTNAVMQVFNRKPDTWTSGDLERVYDYLAFAPDELIPDAPVHSMDGMSFGMTLLDALESTEIDPKYRKEVAEFAHEWKTLFNPEARAGAAADIEAMLDGKAPFDNAPRLMAYPAYDQLVTRKIYDVRGSDRARRALVAIKAATSDPEVFETDEIRAGVIRRLKTIRSAVSSGSPATAAVRKDIRKLANQNLRRVQGTLDDGYGKFPDYSELGQLRALIGVLQQTERFERPQTQVVNW
jgi:hypothetical protein